MEFTDKVTTAESLRSILQQAPWSEAWANASWPSAWAPASARWGATSAPSTWSSNRTPWERSASTAPSRRSPSRWRQCPREHTSKSGDTTSRNFFPKAACW